MESKELRIPYPSDLPAAAGQTEEEFQQELRLLVAAKLYEMGRLSSGRAAELAGLSRAAFLEALGAYHISVFNYGADELEREIAEARARARRQKP